MHEATLAENILQIAQDVAAENHAQKISAVGLKLGEMAGVEIDALKFSFDVLKKRKLTAYQFKRNVTSAAKFLPLQVTIFFARNVTGF